MVSDISITYFILMCSGILILSRSDPETFGPTPACRNNHTTAVYGDKIYFHGGHDGNQWLDDLYVLSTSSMVW